MRHSRQFGAMDGTDMNTLVIKSIKRITVMLRTLFSFCRIVPAFQCFQRVKQSRGTSLEQIDFALYVCRSNGDWEHVNVQRPHRSNLNHTMDLATYLEQQHGSGDGGGAGGRRRNLAFDESAKIFSFSLPRVDTPTGNLSVHIQYEDNTVLDNNSPSLQRLPVDGLGFHVVENYSMATNASPSGVKEAPSQQGVAMQHGERQRQPRPNSPLRSGLGALLKHDDAARSKDEHRNERDVTQTDSWSMEQRGHYGDGYYEKSRPGQASYSSQPVSIPSSNQDRGGNYLRNVHDHGRVQRRGSVPQQVYSRSEGSNRAMVGPLNQREYAQADVLQYQQRVTPSNFQIADGTSPVDDTFSRLDLMGRQSQPQFRRRGSSGASSDASTTPPFLSASPGSLNHLSGIPAMESPQLKLGISCSPPFPRTSFATSLLSSSPQQMFMDSRPYNAASMANSVSLAATNAQQPHHQSTGRLRSKSDSVFSTTPPNNLHGIRNSQLQQLPESPFLPRNKGPSEASGNGAGSGTEAIPERRRSMSDAIDAANSGFGPPSPERGSLAAGGDGRLGNSAFTFEYRGDLQMQHTEEEQDRQLRDELDSELPFACADDGLFDGQFDGILGHQGEPSIGAGDGGFEDGAMKSKLNADAGSNMRNLDRSIEVSSFVHLIESAPQLSLFSSTMNMDPGAISAAGIPMGDPGCAMPKTIEDELAEAEQFGNILRASMSTTAAIATSAQENMKNVSPTSQ